MAARRLAKTDAELSLEFSQMVPFYLALGIASILGTGAVIAVSRRVRDHPSAIILIITLVDLLYTLKYMAGALAWLLGQRDERASFHLIADDCVSSLAYGQFMGMASISWNAVWTYDFLCVLANPLRRTDGQRRWYHVFVWTLCVVTTVYVLAAGVNEGSNDHTCWVRADNANSLIFEVPLYSYMALALFSLLYAAVRLKGCSRQSLSMLSRHAAYVIAFISLWLWPILHRFYDENDKTYWLTLLDTLAVSGQAFVFSLIRLSEPGAWAELVSLLRDAAGSKGHVCRWPAAALICLFYPCCRNGGDAALRGPCGACCGGEDEGGEGAAAPASALDDDAFAYADALHGDELYGADGGGFGGARVGAYPPAAKAGLSVSRYGGRAGGGGGTLELVAGTHSPPAPLGSGSFLSRLLLVASGGASAAAARSVTGLGGGCSSSHSRDGRSPSREGLLQGFAGGARQPRHAPLQPGAVGGGGGGGRGFYGSAPELLRLSNGYAPPPAPASSDGAPAAAAPGPAAAGGGRAARFGSVDGGLASYLPTPQPPAHRRGGGGGGGGGGAAAATGEPKEPKARTRPLPPPPASAAAAGSLDARYGGGQQQQQHRRVRAGSSAAASDAGGRLSDVSVVDGVVVPLDRSAGHMALRSALLAQEQQQTHSRRQSTASGGRGGGGERTTSLLVLRARTSHEPAAAASANERSVAAALDAAIDGALQGQAPHPAAAAESSAPIAVRPRGAGLQRYLNQPVASGLAMRVLVQGGDGGDDEQQQLMEAGAGDGAPLLGGEDGAEPPASVRTVMVMRQRSMTADDLVELLGGAAPATAAAPSPMTPSGVPAGGPPAPWSPNTAAFMGAAAPAAAQPSSLSSSGGLSVPFRPPVPGSAAARLRAGGGGAAAGMSSSLAAQGGIAAPAGGAHAGAPSGSNGGSYSPVPPSLPSSISSASLAGMSATATLNPSTGGRGWDVAASLRLDFGSAMLSGLCQALLDSEADRLARGGGTCAAALPAAIQAALAASSDDPAAQPAPGPRRDMASLLRDHAVCATREVPLLVGFDAEAYLEHAACVRAGGGGGGGKHASGRAAAAHAAAGGAKASVGATLLAGTSLGNSSFEVITYGESTFAALRAAAALSPASIVYLLEPGMLRSGALRAHFSEGASASFFCRSADQALVVKTITSTEVEELMRLLPAYAAHMLREPHSLLCRFYGCFSIKPPSSSRVYFLLMGNVFPIVHPGSSAETYDLKGSTVGRRAKLGKGALAVAQNLAAQTVAAAAGLAGGGAGGDAQPAAASASSGGGGGGGGAPKGPVWQDGEFRERYPRGMPVSDADAMGAALAPFTSAHHHAQHQHGAGGGGGGGGAMQQSTLVEPAAKLSDVALGMRRSLAIIRQLQRDSALLVRYGIMDYSLLIHVTPVTDLPLLLSPPPPATGASSAPSAPSSLSSSGVGSLSLPPSVGSSSSSGGGRLHHAPPPHRPTLETGGFDPHTPRSRAASPLLPSPLASLGGGDPAAPPLLPAAGASAPPPPVSAAAAGRRLSELSQLMLAASAGSGGGSSTPTAAQQAGGSGGGGGGFTAGGGAGGRPPPHSGSRLPLLPPPASGGASQQPQPQPQQSGSTFGVSYRLSFNHAPTLALTDAVMLIKAANGLPAQITQVGEAVQLQQAAATAAAAMASSAANAPPPPPPPLLLHMNRWSPLAVSAVALGIACDAAGPAPATPGGGGGASTASASGVKAAAAGSAAAAAAKRPHAAGDAASPSTALAAHPSGTPDWFALSAAASTAPASVGAAGSLLAGSMMPPSTADGSPGGLLDAGGSEAGAAAQQLAAVLALFEAASAGPTYARRAVVQIGVIDILQPYDVTKRMENAYKQVRQAVLTGGSSLGTGVEISAVDPVKYAARFLDFAKRIFTPVGSGASAPATCAAPAAPGGGGGAAVAVHHQLSLE